MKKKELRNLIKEELDNKKKVDNIMKYVPIFHKHADEIRKLIEKDRNA